MENPVYCSIYQKYVLYIDGQLSFGNDKGSLIAYGSSQNSIFEAFWRTTNQPMHCHKVIEIEGKN